MISHPMRLYMPTAYKERVLYHTCVASISYGDAVYHIANGDISLKSITNYDIIILKEGAFMSESKLRDMLLDFTLILSAKRAIIFNNRA